MTLSQLILFAVQLLAGTGVFLVGVRLLTSNIEQLATSRIRDLFSRTADKRLVNVGIGAAATALIQSSGVTTVLIVGFVNVGVMNLYQATAMIMGANIGTTITAQIAALSAFPFTTYIEVLVFIGMMIALVARGDTSKRTGLILAGLGQIFIGLGLMSEAMKINRDAIQHVFSTVTNPLLLFCIGILLTALVQSSSATTSIVIAMSVAGLTIGSGGNEVLFIILGTNIGSCVTALMSSLGAGTNAKRASLIHLLFNSFGSILFLILLTLVPSFMEMTFARLFSAPATQIAMFHTFFNLVCTLIFLPFTSVFVRVSEFLVRDRKAEAAATEQTFLDPRMLSSASLAIEQIKRETMRMAEIAMNAFRAAYRAFVARDTSKTDSVQEEIEHAGRIGQNILSYLISLSSNSKTEEERRIAAIHSNVGDIMRIADIADNMTKYTRNVVSRSLSFSEQVYTELDQMVEGLETLYTLMCRIILEEDPGLLPALDAAEDRVDAFRRRLIDGHIERLNAHACAPENSGVYINLVSNLERLGDHMTYIAHTVEG